MDYRDLFEKYLEKNGPIRPEKQDGLSTVELLQAMLMEYTDRDERSPCSSADRDRSRHRQQSRNRRSRSRAMSSGETSSGNTTRNKSPRKQSRSKGQDRRRSKLPALNKAPKSNPYKNNIEEGKKREFVIHTFPIVF